MKNLLILGAGTAGTMMANKLAPELETRGWKITLVDQSETHYYQPGFLFIPFGIYSRDDVIKPRRDYIPASVELVMSAIDTISPDKNQVALANGKTLRYDALIIATGSDISPEETEGLTGEGWQRNIFDFYTIDGATKLAEFLKYWEGGKMVMSVTEMPIKCPVAPLEFVFLADWFFTEQGIRDKVEIEYVTPLPGAFTKPVASEHLGNFLEKKNIKLTTDFDTGSVDGARNKLISYDETEIDYDLLVIVPTVMGAEVIGRSEMGDELRFVPTHERTLQHKEYENIFVIGDAADIPASKAGSVAHFASETLHDNILRYIDGRPLLASFDGHANCFIESGFGKGLLIDFNYDVEPLPGKFPLPGVGPYSLLEESKMNHWGKMMFRWMYWNILLRGAELPLESQLSMAGKRKVS